MKTTTTKTKNKLAKIKSDLIDTINSITKKKKTITISSSIWAWDDTPHMAKIDKLTFDNGTTFKDRKGKDTDIDGLDINTLLSLLTDIDQ